MTSYNPKKVFRAVSNELMKEFFEKNGQFLEVDWTKSGKQYIGEIFRQFISLSENECCKLENLMHEVHDVASDDDNIASIRKESELRGIVLSDDFWEWKNYDIAMWIYLKHENMWDTIVRFAHADRLPKRSWTARIGLPKEKAGFSEENNDELKKAITGYMHQKEGRGKYCYIEYFERGKELEYYFVYLNNFTGLAMHWEKNDEFKLMQDRRSFEIVFVFNRKEGKLELNSQGDKNLKETLLMTFAKVILGIDEELNPDEKPAYNIGCLKDRNFVFKFGPEDGISSVSVQTLTLSIPGCPGSRREYEEKQSNLYDAMDREINKENLPLSICKVEKAKLYFKLEGRGRSNSQTIKISRNSCDVKNKPEKIRAILEKCLKESGLYAA